ncbi:hypothetical protein [Amycolatopsis sp. NPDC059657]|uniref:hypothetical protein n=1 Tax=Amycolatopsis sp. NPDC059657 TaxID=3346899 RepID=UPI00367311BC
MNITTDARAPQPDEVLVWLDTGGPGFPATVEQELWNGSEIPGFRAPVVAELVRWLNTAHTFVPFSSWTATFTNDVLHLIDNENNHVDTVTADERGRYRIEGWGWTRSEPMPDNPLGTAVVVTLSLTCNGSPLFGLPAVLADHYDTDGHVIPRVTRDQLPELIEGTTFVSYGRGDWHRLIVDGDDLVRRYCHGNGVFTEVSRTAPDADGRYAVPGYRFHVAAFS